MCQLLEQTRTQTLQMQTQFEEEIRRLKQTVQEKDHLQEEIRSQHEQIAQLTAQIHQLQNQEKHWRTQVRLRFSIMRVVSGNISRTINESC